MIKYKLILNFNEKNECILYFKKITKSKIDLMLKNNNYILLTYNDFMKKYIYIDFKLDYKTNDKIDYFNNNIEKYCYN